MALKLEKSDVWVGEVRDRAGGLDEKLAPLAAAGADLSFLVARRQPDKPGTGVVFLGGVSGAKQAKAAKGAGLSKANNVFALRIESGNKPGIAHQALERISSAGISLRGVSALVIGTRCVILAAFDSAADRDKAYRLLNK